MSNRDHNKSRQGKEGRIETEEEKEGEDEAAAPLPNNNQEKALDSFGRNNNNNNNSIPNNNNVPLSTASDTTLGTTTTKNHIKWNKHHRKDVCFEEVEEASPNSSKEMGKESKDNEVAEDVALEVDTNQQKPPVEAEKEVQEPSVKDHEGQVYPVDTRVAKIFDDPANNGIRRLYQGRVVSYSK